MKDNMEDNNYEFSENLNSFADENQIDVESTSICTASVTPFILTQSKTDVTRIIFEPKLIDNVNDSKKSVSGKLIYEKKSKGDAYPTEKISPISVKTGECIEISLDTTATLNLFHALSQLYKIYSEDGLPYGYSSYKLVNNSFNDFLSLIKNDPSTARLICKPENFELVKILIQLITRTESFEALANALKNLENSNLLQLTDTVNIEKLNRVINFFDENIDNANEDIWQNFFKDNQWVLPQLFATPCTIFKDKAYVGGKTIDNQGGNICDFIYQNKISNNVALIEIKTPRTRIVQDAYRQTHSFTTDFSGAINQVINYRDSLIKNYNSLFKNGQPEFTAFSPKCVVVIGKLSSLDLNQKATFENYRNCLSNIEIITYDEIVTRLKDLRNIFDQSLEVNNT